MIKVVNGFKFRVEKMACPFVSNTFRVTGGWGGWIVPKPTSHFALDGMGTGSKWNMLKASLPGVICNVADIPMFKGRDFLNDQGFAIKCDSGEYVHYHHCDRKIQNGTRVKKNQEGIGIISPDSDGSPNWEGPHCEYRVVTSQGQIQVHPFDYMDRSTKLYGQYRDRQFSMNRDGYIWTRLGPVEGGTNKKYFTVRRGGWRSQVIQEIISAGLWSGSWQQHLEYFNLLNPIAPKGGWKPGDKVVIGE